MPNGGSDCCGTCWFNTRNHGQAGYGHGDNSEPSLCEIRNRLAISNPFWTYCANHPHHNPLQVRVPVGPVYVINDEDSSGGIYPRKAWMPPPDTEEVRVGLLDIVRGATAESARGYPAGYSLVEGAVRQLGELREPRALPELDRLLGFPDAVESEDPFAGDPGRLSALARQAASRIVPPETLVPFRTPTVLGIAVRFVDSGDTACAPILADALEEAGCTEAVVLGYLRGPGQRSSRSWVIETFLGTE